MDNIYDVIILGAGAGGLTSAVYSSRAGLKTVVIEKLYAGGQFINAQEIENMPGFSKISGFDLAANMAAQAEINGAEIVYSEPTAYDLKSEIKSVTLLGGKVVKGKNIIIATGATAKKLGVLNEEKFIGRGVHYCATCDGGFYKQKHVAVIGGGNTAVADAKHLSRIADKVFLIHRRDALRAKGAEVEELNALPNVEILYNCVVSKINSDGKKLTGVRIIDKLTANERDVDLDGMFVAIGWDPNSIEFKDVSRDERGYIITDKHMRTNIPNVYAVGDVTVKDLRQIVTAASDGAIAAEYISANLSK